MKPSVFFQKKPIQWGIIGCGNVTEVKSGPPYQSTPDFKLHTVMRRTAALAEDYAQRHQVPNWSTNAEAVINNPEIDAIYIATPPDSHKKYGLLVSAAGKPCCIEKPMAPSYADSLAIYNAFADKNLPLFIAYYRRSLPRFLKVKEWIDANAIGQVRHIEWLKTRSASPLDKSGDYNWHTDAAIAPGGYFDDLASHGLDLFTFLLGDITAASGIGINQQGLYAAKDAIVGNWIHKNSITGTGTWNFGTQERYDKVTIYGSEGEIKFSVLGEFPVELITATQTESLFIEHPKHLHQYHVANMRRHFLGEGQHPSTGATGLHTSWVMDKILGTI